MAVERRAGVGLQLVGRDQASVGRYCKASMLRLLSSNESPDERYTGVAADPVGHHGIPRSLERRDIRNPPFALEPPGHGVLAVTAETLAHVHRRRVVRDGPDAVALSVERHVVGAHLERIPLVLELGVIF